MAAHHPKMSTISSDFPLFQGVFKLEKAENLHDYLKAIGQSEAKTKVSLKSNLYNSVAVKSSGRWIISVHVKMAGETPGESRTRFRLGQEFEESLVDGRTCIVKYTLEDGNKLVCTQTCLDNELQSSTVTRVFFPDHMRITYECGNVKATGIYMRCSPDELHRV